MGERDHMFLPMVTNLVKKHFNSQLGVIQNSGHVCNLDQPEEFNERSIQFIKSIVSSGRQSVLCKGVG